MELHRAVPALAIALVSVAFLVPRSGAAAQEAEDDVVALIGGEVHTVSGEILAGATVLVRDGRIEAVGTDVAVPAGARRIDCSGQLVTPGLIDADTWLGLGGADATGRVPGADTPISPGFDAWDPRLAEARSQGVTTLHLAGNRTQLLGGVAAVVPTGPEGAEPIVPEGAVVMNASTVQAASGLPAAARISGLRNVFLSAQGREDDLEYWREDLAEYEEGRLEDVPTKEELLLLPPELLERMRTWTPTDRANWRVAVYKGMGREKAYTKPKKPATPPKTPRDDTGAEAVATLLGVDGREPSRRAFLRAELDVDVALTLEIVNDFGLDAVLIGGQGLADRAKDIAKAQARVVLSHTADTSWSATSPLRRRQRGLGAALATAGLRPAIASGAASGARHLRLLAAAEVGEGMSRVDALAAITLWAAEAAGIDDVAGSLEAGKRADIVVWSGDPLSAATRVEHILIAGREVDHVAR